MDTVMRLNEVPYAVPLVLAVVVSTAVAIYAWRRRDTPGASSLALLMTAAAIWSAGYVLELLAHGADTKLFWARMQYFGIVVVPAAWLTFAQAYSGRYVHRVLRSRAVLSVMPLITITLVWTNGLHHLVWQDTPVVSAGPFVALDPVYGPWFWVNAIYSYALLGVGSYLLLRMIIEGPRLFRHQSGALLAGLAIPWTANVAYILNLVPSEGFDLTVFTFPLAGALLAWDHYRFRFLDIESTLGDARTNMVSSPADGLVLIDDRLRVLDLNPAAQAMLNTRASGAIGRSLEILLPALTLSLPQPLPNSDLRTEMRLESESSLRIFEVTVIALGSARGGRGGHLVVLRDATERIETERRLRLLADVGSQLVRSLDEHDILAGVASLCVPALGDLCLIDVLRDATMHPVAIAYARSTADIDVRGPYPLDTSVPSPLIEAINGRQAILLPELHTSAWARLRTAMQLPDVDPAGSCPSAIIVPMEARGDVIGAITLVSMTPARRYQPADVALAEGLARQAALSVDNARLYAQAQAATRAREQLLSIVAHELKTPMTSIGLGMDLLSRRLRQSAIDANSLQRLADQLRSEAQRLDRLVADLLDVSRIQQGRLDLRHERVDLAELAGTVISRFEHSPERAANHTLVLDAVEPVVGQWDVLRIDQVLTNLVSNALKYSPDGGVVTVAVRVLDADAEIVVRDEGIGIAPDEQAALFSPFTRGERARQRATGSGLGLFITSQIVLNHGGSLHVESRIGEGSSFVVRLPLSPPVERPCQAPTAEAKGFHVDARMDAGRLAVT